MIGEIEKDIEEMVRERCRDCVALVEENGIWVCDERERVIFDFGNKICGNRL